MASGLSWNPLLRDHNRDIWLRLVVKMDGLGIFRKWRLTNDLQDDPTHRCQHGRCRGQRRRCAKRTAQILVESEQ